MYNIGTYLDFFKSHFKIAIKFIYKFSIILSLMYIFTTETHS